MKNVIQSLIARKLAPVVLVFALLPVALRAQDTPAAPARDVIDESVIAAEIKRRYPHIELNGKHDIRAVRDPETEDERHTYTVDMIDVVRIWINTGQGAILEKILDAALDDHKDHAVLEFISGYFAFNFPLGLGKNVKNVEQHYRKALKIVEEREQDYAAARTQLALYLVAAGKASEAREQIDLAAARAPNYGEALLLQASVYLSLVKNPEKATAICKQFLALNPEDERQYDKGVQLLREASVQFNNEYESFLNSAYASDIKGVRRARIAVRLAELLIERKEFEKAMELGREALASFEPEQAPLLRMLALGKMAAGAGQLAAKADEEKRAEDAAQFEQQVEVYLREMVELDLKYLTLTDPEKGVAPNSGLFKLTQLLVKRGRAKDAVDVLMDYDKRSVLLTPMQRSNLRFEISDVRSKADLMSVDIWNQMTDEELVIAWTRLKFEVNAACLAGKKLPKLADKEAFEFFLQKAKSLNRKLAETALWCAAGAARALEEKEYVAKVQAVLKEHLGKDDAINLNPTKRESEKTNFIMACITVATVAFPGKDGSVLILDYLDKLAETEGFDTKNENIKDVLPTAMASIHSASGLDEKFKPTRDDKANREGYLAWSKRVREALDNPVEEKPAENKPAENQSAEKQPAIEENKNQ